MADLGTRHASPRPFHRPARGVQRLALATLAGFGLLGCKGDPPKPRQVEVPIIRDTPDALRGTIGSVTTARNVEPIIISGFGLVVGLNGTGGGPLPDRLAGSMERELGLNGISSSNPLQVGTAIEGMSPRDVLNSPNTAVVSVYAVVMPGLPEGASFDVYVRAVTDSGAHGPVSIEGGQLWTTELRIGPPTMVGEVKTTKLAVARGPIFVNPFAEPGLKDDVTRSAGRILSGGLMTNPLKVTLVLDQDSPQMARAIQSSVNTRFAGDPRDPDMIARGRGAKDGNLSRWVMEVDVPAKYRDKAGDFLNLMRYAQIDTSFGDEYARRYVEAVKSQPSLGKELGWALQAIGEPAKPFIRELYESPEIVPRWTALRAGAGLNDPKAIPALKRLAMDGPEALRSDAIRMLGKIEGGPDVDLTLRDFLASSELTVRVAAYEALASRAEQVEANRRLREYALMPAGSRDAGSVPTMDPSRILRLSGTGIQGVSRRVIAGKFILDRVPVGEPLIYVAQQGRPRIVLFGDATAIAQRCLVSGWSDRIIVASDGPGLPVRTYYRDLRLNRSFQSEAPRELDKFINFLAHEPSPEAPEAGLGLTYSEVVGALYLLHQQGGTGAAFAMESDELQARLLKVADAGLTKDRPELTTDVGKTKVDVYRPAAPMMDPTDTGPVLRPDGKPSLVVPNTKPPEEEDPKQPK